MRILSEFEARFAKMASQKSFEIRKYFLLSASNTQIKKKISKKEEEMILDINRLLRFYKYNLGGKR